MYVIKAYVIVDGRKDKHPFTWSGKKYKTIRRALQALKDIRECWGDNESNFQGRNGWVKLTNHFQIFHHNSK